MSAVAVVGGVVVCGVVEGDGVVGVEAVGVAGAGWLGVAGLGCCYWWGVGVLLNGLRVGVGRGAVVLATVGGGAVLCGWGWPRWCLLVGGRGAVRAGIGGTV